MKTTRKINIVLIFAFLFLNLFSITLVLLTVINSINRYNENSYQQNLENIQTLSDSSVDKIRLFSNEKTLLMRNLSSYVSNYHNKGMTLEELQIYLEGVSNDVGFSWQIIQSERTSPENSSEKILYQGIGYTNEKWQSLSYNINDSLNLAAFLARANAENLLTLSFTTEFLDVTCLEKAFAITTIIRLFNNQDPEYRTLMMVIKSKTLNDVMANSSHVNDLNYENLSMAIIDVKGSYIFSTTAFQGYNFIQYLSIYNPNSFTVNKKNELLDTMKKDNCDDVLFYRNNREEDCVFTVSAIPQSDWLLLTVVPSNSFHYVNNYSEYYLYFSLAIGLVVLINFSFILIMNIRLRIKTKEANAANNAKSSFLSSMSHDIRTPMNAIIGMTAIAMEDLKKTPPDLSGLRNDIKTIETSGTHLITLINDILDISKIESGKVLLSHEEISLTSILCNNVTLIKQDIIGKGLNFTFEMLDIKHEYVMSDETRLSQVFINILSNAVKYTEKGKVAVTLREETFNSDSKIAQYCFTVQDTGIGMCEEFMKDLFTRFYRAIDSRINKVQGTGLGLSIVKKLLDIMGGTITVSSQIDVGSTFTVRLPLETIDHDNTINSLPISSVFVYCKDEQTNNALKLFFSESKKKIEFFNDHESLIANLINCESSKHTIFVEYNEPKDLNFFEQLKKLDSSGKIVSINDLICTMPEEKLNRIEISGELVKPVFASKIKDVLELAYQDNKRSEPHRIKPIFDLNVFVAEDNDINWKMLKRILLNYSIEGKRANNGAELMEMIERNTDSIDLVLMDIEMPKMNGYQATEKIRALKDKEIANVPIYAMTANTFAEDVAKCLKMGMNGHLPKPIDLDKLEKILKLCEQNKKHLQ